MNLAARQVVVGRGAGATWGRDVVLRRQRNGWLR